MSKKELRDLLYQKASKEQDEYIEHLKTLFPQEIIDKSYLITIIYTKSIV